MTPLQTSKHREQALVAAMMSFVLLKNNNRTLPLWAAHKYSKVAVNRPRLSTISVSNRHIILVHLFIISKELASFTIDGFNIITVAPIYI